MKCELSALVEMTCIKKKVVRLTYFGFVVCLNVEKLMSSLIGQSQLCNSAFGESEEV